MISICTRCRTLVKEQLNFVSSLYFCTELSSGMEIGASSTGPTRIRRALTRRCGDFTKLLENGSILAKASTCWKLFCSGFSPKDLPRGPCW